jgi:hypothetical protein
MEVEDGGEQQTRIRGQGGGCRRPGCQNGMGAAQPE